MNTTLSISVCIPTYKRPRLLAEAIESCLKQTHLPQEIVIGDNSPDTETQELVEQIRQNCPVEINYMHHVPGLDQVTNVDTLFHQAKGELLLLLHDDDTLVEDCLQNLHSCFVQYPTIDVAVGKQYVMYNDGRIDYALSEKLNKTFYRTPDYEGTKLAPLESVMLQQFPNDCYMIRTSVAKQLGYTGKTNHACDFEFGLKVGLGNHKVFFINKYTASYRLSADALTNAMDNNGALVIYQLVEALNVPAESWKYKAQVLEVKAPVAIAQAANLRLRKEALRIFLSKWHRSKLLSRTGMKGLFHVLKAFR